jgi:hypothetical protein
MADKKAEGAVVRGVLCAQLAWVMGFSVLRGLG